MYFTASITSHRAVTNRDINDVVPTHSKYDILDFGMRRKRAKEEISICKIEVGNNIQSWGEKNCIENRNGGDKSSSEGIHLRQAVSYEN